MQSRRTLLFALLACQVAVGQADCCRSTDDFPWRDLPAVGKTLDVEVDATAPRYRFHPGESAFAAFRLPMASAPYRIEIRALATPDPAVPGNWRVFYPQAALLDADHLVSRTTGAENARPQPVGSELAPEGAYVLYVPVDPAADAERYLVIHTVPPAEAPTPSPGWLRSRNPAMRAALGWQAGPSETGKLRITVLPTNGAR